MKVIKSFILVFALLFGIQATVVGSEISEQDDILDLYKEYINTMVERVEEAEDPADKRAILNNSFDNMITAFERAGEMRLASEKDKEAIKSLKANIQEKKNELNGEEGYRKVADNKLNNFANYVQQDLEQADTVVISISATLLVIILVLLLWL